MDEGGGVCRQAHGRPDGQRECGGSGWQRGHAVAGGSEQAEGGLIREESQDSGPLQDARADDDGRGDPGCADEAVPGRAFED